MAAGQHNPSRRALLGVAAALPLLGAGSAARPRSSDQAPLPDADRPPSGARTERELAWVRALDGYEGAAEAVQEAEAWPADYESEFGERLGAQYEALRRLWRTPAPDLSALTMKLELAIEHELGTLSGGASCLVAIRDDARQLAAVYCGV